MVNLTIANSIIVVNSEKWEERKGSEVERKEQKNRERKRIHKK